jgi:hypothetical protein
MLKYQLQRIGLALWLLGMSSCGGQTESTGQPETTEPDGTLYVYYLFGEREAYEALKAQFNARYPRSRSRVGAASSLATPPNS